MMRGFGQDHDDAAAAGSTRDRTERIDPLAARAAAAGHGGLLGASELIRLQRAVGNAAVHGVVEPSPVAEVIGSGGGAALPAETRADMESRFGQDFSDVRIHTGSAAHESARAMNARAYTVGSDIVFQRDAYAVDSPDGRLTLAHELTHVVQQRNGPVDGTDAGDGVRVSDPSDRFEREAVATAERVLSTETTVQREESDEEDPIA